jgi:hypothetical protein
MAPRSSNPKGNRAATRKEIRGARKTGELPTRRTLWHAKRRGTRVYRAVLARGYGPQLAMKAGQMEGAAVLRKKGFAVRGSGGPGNVSIRGTAKSRSIATGGRSKGGGRRQRRDRNGKFA